MSNPTYFTVVGDFRSIVQDLDTDSDYNPNIVPISATVTFTPILNSGDLILATNATPNPIGFIPAPVSAIIDPVDGQLKLRATPDSGGTGDYVPVRLLADTPLLELAGPLYYNVYFTNVSFADKSGRITGFAFQAPTVDTTLDLITVARTPGSPPGGINKIAPTDVRFEDGTMVFSFGGVDIPEALPLTEITGPTGATGPTGPAATVTVGSVSTLAPGSSATVVNDGDEYDAIFDFGIPRGATGATGPASTVTVGTVSNLAPGSTASVQNSGDQYHAVFNFGIPEGTAATVDVGTTDTLAPGSAATVTNSGDTNAAVFDFGIPAGVAATIEVGTVSSVEPGEPATVTNTGDSQDAVFDFEIPQGAAATVDIGTVTTGAVGSSVTVTNTGTSNAAVFDFSIPRGDTGATGATGDKGDAATVTVGTVTTLNPGESASITNTGTAYAAVFDFEVPQGPVGETGPVGPTGATGPAATIEVGTVTTGAVGSSAVITNVGTSGAAVFDITIPRGDTGPASPSNWTNLEGRPVVVASGATEADARASIDAEYTGNKGVTGGYASLDSTGKVPLEQLPVTQADWDTLEGKPAVIAAGATEADARTAIDAEYTGNKGATGGYASLDETGKVPATQLPMIDWDTLDNKPAVIAAGATGADARAAIDAEYTGNKGIANGYAELDSTGVVPTAQIPPGLIVDSVNRVGDTFQFYSGSTAIGSPISLIIGTLDGGSPSSTSSSVIDGGTL